MTEIDYKDKWLRAEAELKNQKERMEKEIEKTRLFSIQKFAKDLTNVEFCLKNLLDSSEGTETFNVVKSTNEELIKILRNNGVEVSYPEGETFDPNFHEALSYEESEYEKGKISKVHRSGWILNGRVIQPALVTVSSKQVKRETLTKLIFDDIEYDIEFLESRVDNNGLKFYDYFIDNIPSDKFETIFVKDSNSNTLETMICNKKLTIYGKTIPDDFNRYISGIVI